MPYTIRMAASKDARDICTLLHRSIRELCTADHANDPNILSQWLEGKTPENIEKWITTGDKKTIVAVDDGIIAGVGAIDLEGTIHLCYVSPDHVGKGVGSALIDSMISLAQQQKNHYVTLTSTKTAKHFYEHHGFVGEEQTVNCFGVPGYPMSRAVDI